MWVFVNSLLKDKNSVSENESLYLQPPTITISSSRITVPIISPTGMCPVFLVPLNQDNFCSVTFINITTNRKRTATAPT